MSPVIDVRDLHKHFGRVRALDGLDLQVDEGEIHGFLGPNGAGKSTTIRVLLGILKPDSGAATVFGRDAWRFAVELHSEMAYVPGDVVLWPNLTGGEIIDLLARMRGGIDPKRRDDLVNRFELDPKKKARTYSKGNRQKVSLISAFSSNARLLLLDEPSSGLDPLMERVFRDCLTEARHRGVTVFVSSHILSEMDALCDRVTIVRAGRSVESGSLNQLRHLSRISITVEFSGPPADLRQIRGVCDVVVDGHVLHAQVDPDALNDVLRVLSTVGVRSLISQPPTLEEIFLRHYRLDHADAAAGTVTA